VVESHEEPGEHPVHLDSFEIQIGDTEVLELGVASA
jgi:hypothetical protein